MNMLSVTNQELRVKTLDSIDLELSWQRKLEVGIGLELLTFNGHAFQPLLCRRIFDWLITQGFSISTRTVCRCTLILKKELEDDSGRQYVVWLGIDHQEGGQSEGYFASGILRCCRGPNLTPAPRTYWIIGD
jgi:hypothetical protein